MSLATKLADRAPRDMYPFVSTAVFVYMYLFNDTLNSPAAEVVLVSIATRYGPNALCQFMPAPRLSKPPVQWVPRPSWR